MVMIRKRILMPQNLKKKTEKAPKKPKKARNFKIAKKAQKSPNFFGSFRSGLFKTNFGVQGFFFIAAVKKSPGIKILSLLISHIGH